MDCIINSSKNYYLNLIKKKELFRLESEIFNKKTILKIYLRNLFKFIFDSTSSIKINKNVEKRP